MTSHAIASSKPDTLYCNDCCRDRPVIGMVQVRFRHGGVRRLCAHCAERRKHGQRRVEIAKQAMRARGLL